MAVAVCSTFAAIAGVACGASEAEVRKAETSGYKTDFAIVYSTTLDVVRDLYPGLVEDARTGVISTAWHPVNVQQGADINPVSGAGPAANPNQVQGGGVGAPTQSGPMVDRERYFVRFDVHVIGGRPWEVHVHGQAALWKTGDIPTPLHGADVPQWLKGRTDSLEVAIYRRLKQYAVRLPPERKHVTTGPPLELERFSALPPGAARVLAEVQRAAETRDARALRPFLADDVTYNLGQAPSADTAVVVWQADTTVLAELDKALSAGCALDQAKQQIVCPATYIKDPSFTGYRAGFQMVGGQWKMIFFVAGE
jgi:hypothetical protein